jgi:5-hydroxyisourate hydrolase
MAIIMSKISTHVLDTVLGRPAQGIAVQLGKKLIDAAIEAKDAVGKGEWSEVGRGFTDGDGRCRDLVEEAGEGIYRLIFQTGPYLSQHGRRTIYPEIVVIFACSQGEHYHLPLLLSDNSYTTYRGS